MNKRELEREIGKMIQKLREIELAAWGLKMDIAQKEDIMQLPATLNGIHSNLSVILDKLAVIERECKMRYNKEKRKREE